MRNMSTNYKKIKNTITSDTYLDNWGRKNIPQFKGVISRDRFPAKFAELSRGDSIIINLDPQYSTGGSHWVGLRFSSEAPLVLYKDSFGAPPPEEVRSAVLNSGYGLVYGTRIYQKISQENCGKLSLIWLKTLSDAAKKGQELEIFRDIEE